VTDEVREITWFYKQRLKHTSFVKPVNLYHEKQRLTYHRIGSIKAYFLILPGHYKRKMVLYSSSKPEGNHANLTNTFHFQTKVFWGWGEPYRIPYRSTQHKTGRVQTRTFTRTATASSHTQHYDVIWMC